jgi:hypothetical protein
MTAVDERAGQTSSPDVVCPIWCVSIFEDEDTPGVWTHTGEDLPLPAAEGSDAVVGIIGRLHADGSPAESDWPHLIDLAGCYFTPEQIRPVCEYLTALSLIAAKMSAETDEVEASS